MKKKGILITFEGGEGCGKSYQSRVLNRRLVQLALPVVLTHEPGGTPFGEKISKLLKWDDKQALSPLTEMLLFNASRVQLVENIIKPALDENKIVICDRYTDSTTVYQGYARGLDAKLINLVNNASTQNIQPDLTILLDLPVGVGLSRKRKQRQDRFHMENISFHQRVRDGFLDLAAKSPKRWLVIHADQPRNAISGIIWIRITGLLVKSFSNIKI